MKKKTERKPFYRDRNWLTGFIFSLVAVLLIYYLAVQSGRMEDATRSDQSDTKQASSLEGTAQPKAGWKEGVAFTAPGKLPSDLLRVDDEVWVFTDEGKKLERLTLEGKLLSEITLEVLCSKAAWDGETVWCVNMSTVVSRVNPETGVKMEEFDSGSESIQSIAWDGESLWLMGKTGGLARYERSGEQIERKRVADYGFARDLAWTGEELWVVYIPPQLVRYDRAFKVIEKTSVACGLSEDLLEYSIDWDGESLWFLDFISARTLQCVPVK